MELKQRNAIAYKKDEQAFNRTFMELKLYKVDDFSLENSFF